MHISPRTSPEPAAPAVLAASPDEVGLGLALVRARRRRRRLWWGGVAALAAVAIGVAALRAAASPQVTVMTVAAQPVERVLAVTGRVRAKESVAVLPKASGEIVALTKDDGDLVGAGEVLGRIDDARARATVEQAAAAADAQSRVLAQAERDLARAQTLLERGTVTAAAVEAATLAVTRGREDLRRLQSVLNDAELRLAEYAIVAPLAGRVLDRPIDAGQVVDARSVLFEIAPIGAREIETEVDEAYSMSLALGQEARMAFAGVAAPVTGRVTYLSPQIDAATGGRVVRLEFDAGPDAAELPVGLSVDVNIVVDRQDAALTVPRAAIRDIAADPSVLVLEGNVVTRRPVRFTDWPAASVVVTDGIRVGDRVIVDALPPAVGAEAAVAATN
ncbi:MAG: efflux RND transporter periplasmic adaptor subunit [Rhodospirillaceae bacterium]|nr:efflux RND transporter periplasmic adaptor subunit [Rhodospirillaceae bacterium]